MYSGRAPMGGGTPIGSPVRAAPVGMGRGHPIGMGRGLPIGMERRVPLQGSILNTLQAADMSDRKRLPAEIMVAILDYLPVADLVRCAQASRRLREMVYDDSRWVARLRSMGCWDEAEARRHFDEAVRKKREAAAERAYTAGNLPKTTTRHSVTPNVTTLFDAALEEEEEAKRRMHRSTVGTRAIRDGFETMTLDAPEPPIVPLSSDPNDPTVFLDAFKNVKSIRGGARQEYAKIYGALAPFYFDLARARSHTDPAVFKAFRDPERQAQMLANLARFAQSDWAAGWQVREERLSEMSSMFEAAVLREFEHGYENWDIDGRMRRYAHVLDTLNGGAAGVDVFIQRHPLLNDRRAATLHNPLECINRAAQDDVLLDPSRLFFDGLLARLNEQADVVARIFPSARGVFWALVDKVREDVVMEYTVPLFEQAHERSVQTYLKAMSGLFEQAVTFYGALRPPPPSSKDKNQDTDSVSKARELAQATFDPHLDTYLREELEFFISHADQEVDRWGRKLSEEHASVESLYMGNLNRQAVKKDFLSSFKKVVMMPVNVLPTNMGLPFSSPFAGGPNTTTTTTTPGTTTTTAEPEIPPDDGDAESVTSSKRSSKRDSIFSTPATSTTTATTTATTHAPDDELAAKAALMQSRLEGIRSLFSIEVALNLVHAAKTSLGRIAVFIPLGGQWGGEAKEQCAAVFVNMLRILGGKHMKNGFDMAVSRLSRYNPREGHSSTSTSSSSVAPLVVFIELVNVGDLISQMVDVFYDQQLITARIADRNDFLDPAGLAKKKFEQMLDESVAAGLNKGIDVLMDEVDYLNSTTQLPTDYNPPEANSVSSPPHTQSPPSRLSRASLSISALDIGPTPAALRVVDLVTSHVRMLAGSTEKTMLDVFNAEVGLRLFAAVCKHLKRQRISTAGAVSLIADMNLYFDFVRTLRNQDLLAYFRALRELSQIYLIDARHAKEMAIVIADGDRFGGIFRAEEVYEFAQRRADWYQVRRDVERAMYGLECVVI